MPYVTEGEAAELWCPWVRLAIAAHGKDYTGSNRAARKERVILAPDQSRCIASECMMWRWNKSNPNNVGFCGVAGKPEGDGP